MSNIQAARVALTTRILDGDGEASPALRRAAFDNAALTEPLGTLVRKVAEYAHGVTDADVAQVRASGLSEDQIFELVVCAAVGQATRQYEAALAALDAAEAEE
jgi:alkylhydroperoxidase family enzyme